MPSQRRDERQAGGTTHDDASCVPTAGVERGNLAPTTISVDARGIQPPVLGRAARSGASRDLSRRRRARTDGLRLDSGCPDWVRAGPRRAVCDVSSFKSGSGMGQPTRPNWPGHTRTGLDGVPQMPAGLPLSKRVRCDFPLLLHCYSFTVKLKYASVWLNYKTF
jgi:hypothetical protein